MKTKSLTRLLSLSLLAGGLLFTACKKKTEEKQDDTTTTDTEQSSAQDNSVAESIDNDIQAMGSQGAETGTLSTFRSNGQGGIGEISMAPCATVTTVQGSKIFTVDFGTTGCTGSDGKTRTGKLIYDFSGSTNGALYYRHPGFKMTVTSSNYVVDNYSVTISNKTIQNTTPTTITPGYNPGTSLTWSVTASISITKPSNGGTVSWSCNRTHELMNTSDTNCYRGQTKPIIWSKAKLKMNGTASGVNSSNENYSVVATDLVRDFNCSPVALQPHRHPFISGTLVYTPGSRPARTIDYGSGACDLTATITVSGQSFTYVQP